MSAEKKAPRIPWLSIALVIALSILNLLLIIQNLNLRKQLSGAGAVNASANALRPGDTVTSITGTDLNGRPSQVQYGKDGKRQLLLFFSPSCLYCVKQGPIWRDVLNRIDTSRFNVVGIVGDKEDKKEVTTHGRSGLFQH